jgi:hypothetical protein
VIAPHVVGLLLAPLGLVLFLCGLYLFTWKPVPNFNINITDQQSVDFIDANNEWRRIYVLDGRISIKPRP